VEFLVGMAFFAVVCTLFVCYEAGSILVLNAKGVVTEARVLEVFDGRRQSWVRVEFTTRDGDVVRAKCYDCSVDVADGESIRIRYLPDAPEADVGTVDARGHKRTLLLTLVCAVVFAALTVLGYRRRSRPKPPA
jgi:hypothetical protein